MTMVFFVEKIPDFFVFLGIRPHGATMDEYPINYSPRFKVDEAALQLGVRTCTVDYLLHTS